MTAAQTTAPSFMLQRNAHGRLVLTLADGTVHEGVQPVRAFPMQAPDEGISLLATSGREVLWIAHVSQVAEDQRRLLAEDFAVKEFIPVVHRLLKVSSFSTPSTWTLETDRGPAQMVLKGEEDIRRLDTRSHLLITSRDGVQYRVPDVRALDRESRRLIERFS